MSVLDAIKKSFRKSEKDSAFLKIEAEIISVLGCEPSPEGTRDELRAWMASKCADPKWREYSISKNKKQEPEISKPEISETGNPFSCPACGSLEVWLPRVPGIDETKSENWRCCVCQPTSNRTLVLKVRNGSQQAAEGGSSSLGTFESRDAPKSIVVAQGWAACPECKCSWVRETPTGGGNVDLSCWSCGVKIDPERKIERWEFKPFRFTKAERVV